MIGTSRAVRHHDVRPELDEGRLRRSCFDKLSTTS
jgi:hypothetical protein